MIQELKITMINMNIHMYMCTNFHEHSYLDTEDTHTRMITNSLFFLVFCVYFSPFLQVSSTQPPKLRKNGPQHPIEDYVILHEMY